MLRLRVVLLTMMTVGAASGLSRAEGPGIKLGDQLVLHPGIAAEFRWDSNVFFEPSNPTNAFLFRLLPTLDLATRPPQRGGDAPHTIDFRLHLGADYNEYLTSDSNISQHRAVGVQGGLLLTLFPKHQVSVDIYDNYVRTAQPPYFQQPFNIDRDTNEAGVRLRVAPGGGRLQLDVSYAFGIDFFEEQQFQELNVMYHRADVRLSWKFFPKTAVYIDVSDQPYIYPNPGTTMHPNSYPLRAVAGIIGLLTAKLSLNAWIGYGNGFYVTTAAYPANPNTPIGGVSLTWKPTMLSTGTIGYRHDFVNSLLGEYYDFDGAYISWSQLIWRFVGSLRLEYSNIRYQGITDVNGVMPLGSRTDNFVRLNLRVDYPFKDYLIGSIGYDLQYDQTDSMLLGATPGALIGLGYLTNEVWVRFSVLY
jgi:hypothetical protein